MSGFWDMGGYAVFVWPAYGVAAAGLIGISLLTWRQLRARRREADSLGEDSRNEQ